MIGINVRSKGKVNMDPNDFLTIKNEKLKNADFSNKKLVRFCAVDSIFENCNFEKMRLECLSAGAGPGYSEYINCSFDGSKIKMFTPGHARFINCTFKKAILNDMFSFEADFINCVFSGKMKGIVINGSVPKEMRLALGREKNEIYGNDLSGVEMDDVGFRTGVDLSQQKLPDSDDYLYLPNPTIILNQAKEIIINEWSDSIMKTNCLLTIQTREETVAEGQKQLFLLKDSIELNLFDLLKELSEK
jgi:hypothetical protein